MGGGKKGVFFVQIERTRTSWSETRRERRFTRNGERVNSARVTETDLSCSGPNMHDENPMESLRFTAVLKERDRKKKKKPKQNM